MVVGSRLILNLKLGHWLFFLQLYNRSPCDRWCSLSFHCSPPSYPFHSLVSISPTNPPPKFVSFPSIIKFRTVFFSITFHLRHHLLISYPLQNKGYTRKKIRKERTSLMETTPDWCSSAFEDSLWHACYCCRTDTKQSSERMSRCYAHSELRAQMLDWLGVLKTLFLVFEVAAFRSRPNQRQLDSIVHRTNWSYRMDRHVWKRSRWLVTQANEAALNCLRLNETGYRVL